MKDAKRPKMVTYAISVISVPSFENSYKFFAPLREKLRRLL